MCSTNRASIDRNSIYILMDSKFIIDLNQPPPNIDHELHIEEREIPIFVTSSSTRNIIIEINEDNNEIEYPIDVDIHEFLEDNDGASSDSSEEEIVAPETGGNYATITINGELRENVDGLQTTQGKV